jgi:hypothetical protein
LVLTELRGPLLMGMPAADLASGEDPDAQQFGRVRAKSA